MTHAERVALALDDLRARGAGRRSVRPLAHRLLWALGAEIPPPHFQGFVPLLCLFTAFVWAVLAVPLALAFALLVEPRAAYRAAVPTLFPALIAGAILAAYYRLAAARLGLPGWNDYPGAWHPSDSDW